MLYIWQLVKDKLLTTNKRLIVSGRKAMHQDQEEQLFNKLKEWRKEGVLVAYSHFPSEWSSCAQRNGLPRPSKAFLVSFISSICCASSATATFPFEKFSNFQ
jgi:hypothetical protein